MAQGIIHPYYAVALAAPLGGLVGIATMGLWERRSTLARSTGPGRRAGRHCLVELRAPRPHAELVPLAASLRADRGRLGRAGHPLAARCCAPCPSWPSPLVSVLGLGAALAAPLFSTVATATTPHSGAIPSVTPTAQGGFGGPGPGGGFPGGGPGGGFRRAFAGGGFPGAAAGGGFPGGGFAGGGTGRTGTGSERPVPGGGDEPGVPAARPVPAVPSAAERPSAAACRWRRRRAAAGS